MSKNILSGLSSIITGKIGEMLAGLLITPLLVRVLGSENYGDYAFILSVFAVLSILSRAGMSTGLQKYISEDRDRKNWESTVFGFYFFYGITASIIVSAIVWTVSGWPRVSNHLGPKFGGYLILLGVIIISDQLFQVFRYSLMGLDMENQSEPLITIKKVIFGIIGISLAYAGYAISGVLIGMITSSLICALLSGWILRKQISFRNSLQMFTKNIPVHSMIKFNLSNTLFVLLMFSLYNVDILFTRIMIGGEETGIYKSALIVSEFVWLVPVATQKVMVHSVSTLWNEEDYESITDIASRVTRYTLMFTLLLSIGVAVLNTEFLFLYFGQEFTRASLPLLILLPGVVGFAIARPIYAINQGGGRIRPLVAATGAASVINLVFNLLLIPHMGITGAAISTSIGYCSMLVFHGYTVYNMNYTPFKDLRIGPIFITSFTTLLILYVFNSIISSVIISLIVIPPLGILIFSFFSAKTGALTAGETRPFIDQFPHPAREVIYLYFRIIFRYKI